MFNLNELITNTKSFFLIAGPCAIESEEMALKICEEINYVAKEFEINFVFKGSFKKANRSRLDSFTGIGDQKALEILKKVEEIKSENMKLVMTNGCFDIVHAGHIHLLKNAKKFGDFLIVAINSDKSVKSLKGNRRPINKLSDRIELLKSLSFVDLIVVFNELTPIKIIKMLSPDVLVKGGDYKIKDIVGADFVKSKKRKVKIIQLKKGYSTTKLLQIKN